MLIRIAAWITATLAALLIVLVLASWWVSRPLHDESLDRDSLSSIAIAPPEQALTFARYRKDGELRILLVTQYQNGMVTGIDANRRFRTQETDPVVLFGWLGYPALERAIRAGEPSLSIAATELELPFHAHAKNIAIGTNYPEHARESGVPEQPFVFPKLVQPTLSSSTVAKRDSRLLDYEAELGFVLLKDLVKGKKPKTLGLVLANEFTDRWSLVRNLSRGSEMGTTGFVEGKSREGYAPVGNLLVIPKDLDAFYRGLELSLYVNGKLRQRAKSGEMVWGPQQIVDQIFEREGWTFHRYDSTVPLLSRAGVIERGTVIFSGTPAGVIFKPINLWNPSFYLKPGDEVIMRSDYLGILVNQIIE